jgi:hypothetical protein
LWDVLPYNLVEVCRSLRGLHVQGRRESQAKNEQAESGKSWLIGFEDDGNMYFFIDIK